MASATAVTASVSLPSTKSTSLSVPSSSFTKSFAFSHRRNVSISGKLTTVRAQVTTEAPKKVEKISKKQDEGLVTNKYKPKEPYIGRCLLNTKITGDDAPSETWHMIFSTEGV